MKIDLEGLDLTELVQQSCANAIVKTLGASLPRAIETLLNENDRYGKPNLIKTAFQNAVQAEVDKNIGEFIAYRAPEIRRLVRQRLELSLNSELIADIVVESLQQVKSVVHPFAKKVSKQATEDGDGDI